MENKIRNFVYCNDNNYTSYDSAKYLLLCICLFLTLIVGVYAIVTGLWLFLSVLITIDCAFLLHLVLLKFFFKITYNLRFLSDGIIDVLLSSLFLTSAYIVLFATKCNTVVVTYGTLISYLIFVVLHVVLTIINSRSDKYRNSQRSILQKKYLLFIGSLIPVSGIVGIIVAKVIFGVFDFENQIAVYVVFGEFTFVSFLFSLGCSNFIKYFYCIKYKITCDKFGNTTSPKLEKHNKMKSAKGETPPKNRQEKRLPLIVKILIGIACIPIVFFVILFIVFFIKSIIESI